MLRVSVLERYTVPWTFAHAFSMPLAMGIANYFCFVLIFLPKRWPNFPNIPKNKLSAWKQNTETHIRRCAGRGSKACLLHYFKIYFTEMASTLEFEAVDLVQPVRLLMRFRWTPSRCQVAYKSLSFPAIRKNRNSKRSGGAPYRWVKRTGTSDPMSQGPW